MEHKNKFVKSLCIAAFLSILCLPQINSKAMAQDPVPTLDNLHNQEIINPATQDKDEQGNPIEGTGTVYPESAYKLTPIENADPENLPQNAITLYDKTEVIKYYDPQTGQEVAAGDRLPDIQYKEVTTIQTTPKYYTITLKQTEFGSGDKSMTFGWEKNADGNYELKQNPTNPVGQTITYKYIETGFSKTETYSKDLGTIENPSGTGYNHTIIEGGAALNNPTGKTDSIDNVLFKDNSTTGKIISTAGGYKYVDVLGGAVYNEGTLSSVIGAFINNSLDITTEETSGELNVWVQGGAIYNGGTIGDITGDFIGNYVSGFYAYGGAIYNNNGTIGDITGDFIGNYASCSGSYSQTSGGAIDNGSTIGNITGDFIGNYATGSSYAHGGAIDNTGEIGDITGDFIGNYVSSTGSSAHGGAIYNTGEIGDITGDFIGNYASSGEDDAYGGAIYNNNGTIGDITGDFIGNYTLTAGIYASAYGGAIYNRYGTIGDITGDFIGNSCGAIYNRYGTIGDITGDFIRNNKGVAIINTGDSTLKSIIGNVTGDFIGNSSRAIYNTFGTIGNITGDFIGNYTSSTNSSTYGGGGAIYNNYRSTIGDITGDFIGNYSVSSSYVRGGAIFNDGSVNLNVSIGNITGDFIGNYAYSTDNSAYGGAIYNAAHNSGFQATIEDITGGFIGNYASAGSYALGGAIYNTVGIIGNITGDFIENYALAGSNAYGGAIYNSGEIGNITGDFIGNYVSSVEDEANGGAIYNYYRTIGDITGDFIGNYVSSTGSSAHGGAIGKLYKQLC